MVLAKIAHSVLEVSPGYLRAASYNHRSKGCSSMYILEFRGSPAISVNLKQEMEHREKEAPVEADPYVLAPHRGKAWFQILLEGEVNGLQES
jgi:hypothetical protein